MSFHKDWYLNEETFHLQQKNMKDNRIKEEMEEEIVCKLWTQEPENFDEEVNSNQKMF